MDEMNQPIDQSDDSSPEIGVSRRSNSMAAIPRVQSEESSPIAEHLNEANYQSRRNTKPAKNKQVVLDIEQI